MSEHGEAKHGAHDAHAPASAAHADGHAAHGGGHDAHGGRKHHPHDPPPGTPPWLISFGDMMTLFLCFFIMLVTMAKQQDAGLMASGLGPFVAALDSHGMDGALSGADTLYAINTYRKRFGLEEITDPEMLFGAAEVKSAADIEKLVKSALRPYSELRQPLIASFSARSAKLSDASRRYLALLADTLRPGRGQMLILEGHGDSDPADAAADAALAAERARAVRDYLLAEHALIPTRVEARAFAIEPSNGGTIKGGVDARLIQPSPKAEG